MWYESIYGGLNPVESWVSRPKDGRTSYSGYPDGPSMLPRQNPPPSGTGCSPGSYISGTGYNSGGSATVAAAAPEYHGQNNYGPSVNRWPPAQGGYADVGNYATSFGYPTQPNMTPAGPSGPHAGMYHGGHPDYKSEERARRAVVDSVKCIDSKKIDGRITVSQLASARGVANNNNVKNRKVYVGNVPWEVGNERLLECFAAFGEIEEGPLGFEKKSGRAKGFAIFVYKSEEGATKAVVDSVKSIDGYQVMCKMAVDGKKGRAGGGIMPSHGPVPGIVNTDGRTSYSGYPDGPSMLPRQNPPPSGTGSSPGSYISGTGYNSGGSATVAAAAPEYHGQNNYGPSVNRWPQGGYADGGNYAPSFGYPTQSNMTPAIPRGPHAGMYHGGHPDYKS
nr:UBP1-associated protein 2C-like [Tanacetum cinerariifolium]